MNKSYLFSELFIGLFIILSTGVNSQSANDIKRLMTKIFTTDSYNKVIRPSGDLSQTTNLYLNMYLIGITDINEVLGKMSTTAYLEVIWSDFYLKWTPSDYNDTHIIFIPQNDIWKPDIALENGFTKMKGLGDAFILTTVTNDGDVLWYPYEQFDTKCSINVEYFPFDTQTCDIKFGVWTSPVSEIDVELGKKGIELTEYQNNSEWQLISTSANSTQSTQDGAVVIFSVTLSRNPGYYLFNVVAPIVLLSILAVFTFVLPVDCGEKLGFCMTVYLAFAVFLTIVSSSLPVTSTQSLLSKYLLFLVITGTLIVVTTTLQVRIHFWDSSRQIPTWMKVMVKISWRLQCRTSMRKIKDGNNPNEHTEENVTLESDPNVSKAELTTNQTETPESDRWNGKEITWPEVTAAIDFFCFWVFLVTDMVGTIVLFVIGYLQSKTQV